MPQFRKDTSIDIKLENERLESLVTSIDHGNNTGALDEFGFEGNLDKFENNILFDLNDATATTEEADASGWIDFGDNTNESTSSLCPRTPVRKPNAVSDTPKTSNLGLDKKTTTTIITTVSLPELEYLAGIHETTTSIKNNTPPSQKDHVRQKLDPSSSSPSTNNAFETTFETGFEFSNSSEEIPDPPIHIETTRTKTATMNSVVRPTKSVDSEDDSMEQSSSFENDEFDHFDDDHHPPQETHFSPTGNWESFGGADDIGAAAYRQKALEKFNASPQKVSEFPRELAEF